jgi:hypothetical protein
MSQAVLLVRPTARGVSALARKAQCPACASGEVDDAPEDFDPGAWTAPLVCGRCSHRWSVRC